MKTEGPSISVLCVDDEPGFAELVGVSLERSDEQLSTTTATSPGRALDILETSNVDCVVSDFDMPGMDGLEFLEAVRAEYPNLPFILFTGKGSEEIASRAISAGVTDYMQKETGTDQYEVLAQRVHNAVARHRVSEAESRATTILEASPDAIVVSVDAEIVYANETACSLFEADTQAELVGTPVPELVHPDDVEAVVEGITKMYSESTPANGIQRRMQTLTGETVPVEVTARQITWDTQSGIVAIIRDRSEVQRHEQNQARYRAAFEEAFDAMLIADDEGRYVDANESACELLGVEKSELLGSRISEFAPEEFDFEAAWEQFEESERERGTFPLRRADGEHRTIEYAATTDVVPGEHLSVLRDVSDREEYEQQLRVFRRAVEASGHSIYVTDRSGTIEYVNPAFEETTGYTAEEAIGSTPRILKSGVHDREFYEDLWETILSGEIWRSEIVNRRKSGETYVVDQTIAPVEGESGEIKRFVAVNADVTEQKAREEELQETVERLNNFASVVSHDLRNPLTVAQGFLEHARESGDPEQFERVEQSLDRMERIIDDVLWLTREGRDIGTTEAVDLETAVEDAWKAVVDRGTNAELVAPDDSLGHVQADYDRLRQLLENILGNAVEHAAPDATVRVEPIENGFAIADDGPGIPEDVRQTVFERGYSTGTDGTGLGLWIVQQIAEAHGWTVQVSDSEAGGARLEIDGIESVADPGDYAKVEQRSE